jgi:AcrR family transcriptional regulator
LSTVNQPGRRGRGAVVGNEAAGTRLRLIDAALRLFAERGTYQVPLAAIRSSAGQRNTSVVQYHFGNREGLIRAIYQQYAPPVAARSHELLSTLPPDVAPVAIARAIFTGQAELLEGGWRELAFLRFAGEMTTRPEYRFEDITELVGAEQAERVNEAIERILGHGPALSETLREARVRAAAIMVMHTLAEQATLRAQRRRREPLSVSVVLANLADMYVAALTAPVSPEAEGKAPKGTSATRAARRRNTARRRTPARTSADGAARRRR